MKKNYSFGKILFLIFVFLHANVFAMGNLKVSYPLSGPYKDITSVFPSIVITPPESTGGSSSSSSSSSTNFFGIQESDSQIFAKMLSYSSGDLSQGDSISLAQKFVKQIEQQNDLHEIKKQFDKAFYWTAQKGWVEVIKVFLTSDKMVSMWTKEFCRGLFSDLTLRGLFEIVNELLNNKTFWGKFLSLSEGPDDQKKFTKILNSLLSTIFKQNYLWVKIFLRSPSILVLMSDDNLSQAVDMAVRADDLETLSFVPKDLLPKQVHKNLSQTPRDNCNIQ